MLTFLCGTLSATRRWTLRRKSIPSKLMALLSAGVPIMACCDEETETGRLIKEHHCGDWVLPNDADQLAKK